MFVFKSFVKNNKAHTRGRLTMRQPATSKTRQPAPNRTVANCKTQHIAQYCRSVGLPCVIVYHDVRE